MESDPDDLLPDDEFLAATLRRALGLPPGAPVSSERVASFRRQLRAELRRRSSRNAGLTPSPMPARSGRSADEILSDWLAGPEGAAFLYLVESLPTLAAGLAEAVRLATPGHLLLAPPVGREARGVIAYARAKLQGLPLPPPDRLPAPVYRAAVNAATVRQVGEWADSLSSPAAGENTKRRLLGEVKAVGYEATKAARPLEVWHPEPGLPRGLWPDPAPPEDESDDADREAPPPSPGRRG